VGRYRGLNGNKKVGGSGSCLEVPGMTVRTHPTSGNGGGGDKWKQKITAYSFGGTGLARNQGRWGNPPGCKKVRQTESVAMLGGEAEPWKKKPAVLAGGGKVLEDKKEGENRFGPDRKGD